MLEFLIKKFSKTNTFVLSFPQTSICLKSIVDSIKINLPLNFYIEFVVIRITFTFCCNIQLFSETPLHTAAAMGYEDCVKLLVDHGACLEVLMGAMKMTALHLAAQVSLLKARNYPTLSISLS